MHITDVTSAFAFYAGHHPAGCSDLLYQDNMETWSAGAVTTSCTVHLTSAHSMRASAVWEHLNYTGSW